MRVKNLTDMVPILHNSSRCRARIYMSFAQQEREVYTHRSEQENEPHSDASISYRLPAQSRYKIVIVENAVGIEQVNHHGGPGQDKGRYSVI